MMLPVAGWTTAHGTGDASVLRLCGLRDTAVHHRADGVLLALFRSECIAERAEADNSELTFAQIRSNAASEIARCGAPQRAWVRQRG